MITTTTKTKVSMELFHYEWIPWDGQFLSWILAIFLTVRHNCVDGKIYY